MPTTKEERKNSEREMQERALQNIKHKSNNTDARSQTEPERKRLRK
jgi:hypothetical protein